jgi:hypothetical protein
MKITIDVNASTSEAAQMGMNKEEIKGAQRTVDVDVKGSDGMAREGAEIIRQLKDWSSKIGGLAGGQQQGGRQGR